VPDWIETAVVGLVAGSPGDEFLTASLAEHPERIVPLRTFVTAARPGGAACTGDARGGEDARGGGRRGAGGGRPALSEALAFDAQALSLAQFLVAREGMPFFGALVRASIAGRRLEDVLAQAQMVPRELGALQGAWEAWLRDQRPARGGRAGARD
jgi:hypothetical protein